MPHNKQSWASSLKLVQEVYRHGITPANGSGVCLAQNNKKEPLFELVGALLHAFQLNVWPVGPYQLPKCVYLLISVQICWKVPLAAIYTGLSAAMKCQPGQVCCYCCLQRCLTVLLESVVPLLWATHRNSCSPRTNCAVCTPVNAAACSVRTADNLQMSKGVVVQSQLANIAARLSTRGQESFGRRCCASPAY